MGLLQTAAGDREDLDIMDSRYSGPHREDLGCHLVIKLVVGLNQLFLVLQGTRKTSSLLGFGNLVRFLIFESSFWFGCRAKMFSPCGQKPTCKHTNKLLHGCVCVHVCTCVHTPPPQTDFCSFNSANLLFSLQIKEFGHF